MNKERAFPWCGDLNDCPTIHLGMTLRDYFAAKAMAVLMTSAWSIPHAEVASKAYWFAEEMMKAREKE